MPERKPAKPKTENEAAASSFDRQLILEAAFEDLDASKLEEYLKGLVEGGVFGSAGLLGEVENNRAGLAERLLALGLIGPDNNKVTRPRVGALLLFGKQPQRFLEQASLKLARFRGRDLAGMIIDRAELYGPLDKIIEEAAHFVGRNMRVSASIEGLYREDNPEYPLVAVREAVSNAVAHRDYSIMGQKINLRMFDDRLEVESPGGLAGPVTLQNLGQKRYSRNPLLTRLMYELRLVEEMGTGIRRMRQALTELGSDPPRFEADADSFVAILPAHPLPNPKNGGTQPKPAPEVEQEATGFEINESNRAEYFRLLKSGLNERQARGVLYARERGRLTNKEYRAVNPAITDETARLDMLGLVDKGFLLRIGDKKGASYLPRD